ncbi:hypothetical protein P167DRAFT_72068 [Morchella conica CCBAS932]|uniref:Uncharacterized protein n=1 Tax=Morchella conica CCBAS932 TaxID=1392247 RepID=A0A3N4K893_9PEZI|nr:hypothetical protein P167DRAFT_72068 [Morchella conica CCBAS932]
MQVLSLGFFCSSSRLARAPIGKPKTYIVRYFLPTPSMIHVLIIHQLSAIKTTRGSGPNILWRRWVGKRPCGARCR